MTNNADMNDRQRGSRWTIAVWALAAILLLLPLVAMRFTDEVDWTVSDFVIMGALLFGTAGLFEFVVRLNGSVPYRIAAAVALLGTFGLIWLNLAVGIIGSENNPANLMYIGVIGVGIIGSVLTRFTATGMSRTLIAMALIQGLIAVITLTLGYNTLILNGIFVLGWLASAWLFQLSTLQARPVNADARRSRTD